jgi:Plant transposon protein
MMLDDSSDSSWENDIRKRVKVANEEVEVAVAVHIAKIHHVIGGNPFGPQAIEMQEDHRTLQRSERIEMKHARALQSTMQDYTGLRPTFRGREFETMFRISRSRFQRLLEDIMASNIPFFKSMPTDAHGRVGASLHSRLLLPLKTMAYGVPPHTFRDYFQMSETLAREACLQFDIAIKQIYEGEYLRLPDENDLKSITKLHKVVHGIDGMFGSLDCMHSVWKNCPVAWQGSYKGKEKKCTIVLEAISDYHLWFWHAAFGYAGTLNDVNILNLSPFLSSILDGTFEDLEMSCTPYEISGQYFNSLFVCVDGIYPKYARFVRGYKNPISEREKKFTEWQEACRKDIERAFGVLQGRWQCMQRPFHQMNLRLIGLRVAACLILHNMGVSDRVMDNVRDRYDPAKSVDDFDLVIEMPNDLHEYQRQLPEAQLAVNGIQHGDVNNIHLIAKLERWDTLTKLEEHIRLTNAIMDKTSTMQHPRHDKRTRRRREV